MGLRLAVIHITVSNLSPPCMRHSTPGRVHPLYLWMPPSAPARSATGLQSWDGTGRGPRNESAQALVLVAGAACTLHASPILHLLLRVVHATPTPHSKYSERMSH